MPRLFTGIEVPPEVASDLALMRGGLPGARWIDPEDYHLTLRFIGDVGVRLANEIADGLAAIRPRPVVARLERLMVFGGDKPRALVVRISPDAALGALQSEQERLLRRLGAPADTRKFAPHVTIARLTGVAPDAAGAFIEARGDLRPAVFAARRFVLYSSRDSTGGGPYRVEVAYPL